MTRSQIKRIFARNHGSQKVAAATAGVSEAAVSLVLAGRSKSERLLKKLEQYARKLQRAEHGGK